MNDHHVTSQRQLTSQGAERKQQLLDAAARLFAEQGYAATRVVDIVEAAGVAKGLFYWYFDNKEALFRELAAEIHRRLRRTQAQAIDAGAPALVRILQGTVASMRFMAENAPFFSLLQVEGRNVSDMVRQGAEQHLHDVTVLIVEGQKDGTVTDVDPADLLAMAAVGAVGQFSHLHRTGRVDLSLDELSGYVARLVARMLTADEATARASLAALRGRGTATAVS
ncbi:MAG TPA: helix-turn-helix domain-containing protein [Acidimicrobiales bacterium]|nr:helix-turn-helix domain-containing protein [Acidimicrobiales bacterium]